VAKLSDREFKAEKAKAAEAKKTLKLFDCGGLYRRSQRATSRTASRSAAHSAKPNA
jgi:hypothetical protein